jgi:hypothetical protein
MRKRKLQADVVIDLSDTPPEVDDRSLELAKRLEAEERATLTKRLKAEEKEDAALAARLEAEASADPSLMAPLARNGRRGGRVRERQPQPRPAVYPRGRDRRRGRGMNLQLLGIIMDALADRSGVLSPALGQRPQIPPGIDPRLAELMTRDLNANDYETLMELESESMGNRKRQGASDAEIDLLPTFSFGSPRQGLSSTTTTTSSSSSSSSSSSRGVRKVVSLLDDVDEDEVWQVAPPDSFHDSEDDEKQDDKCVVCLEDFESGAHCMRLPCMHYFHADCIREWLRLKRCCPACQGPIHGS